MALEAACTCGDLQVQTKLHVDFTFMEKELYSILELIFKDSCTVALQAQEQVVVTVYQDGKFFCYE